jgi:hypothetical protein
VEKTVEREADVRREGGLGQSLVYVCPIKHLKDLKFMNTTQYESCVHAHQKKALLRMAQ